MIEIDVKKAGGIEKALKLLKRKFTKMGVVKELRNRQAYTKRSIVRRDEIKRAAYRESLQSESNKD
jgi:small subunit ribosomal protein S21